MAKRILLVGANGFIGSALLRELLAVGHQVTACVRNPATFQQHHPQLAVVVADYTTHCTERDWLPLVQGFEVVINSVGIIREQGSNTFERLHTQGPMALFKACAAVGVETVIQISALGAAEPAHSHFLESKRQADDYLLSLPLQSYVLRPSLVYGTGGKSAMLFKALAALPFTPLPDNGAQHVQPVAVEDLARVAAACIDGRVTPHQVVDVVGAEALTLRQMLNYYRQWLGLAHHRFISLPLKPLLPIVRRLGYFGLHGSAQQMSLLLKRGNTAAVAKLTAATGIVPQPMRQALQQTPAQQPDLWHARLYFLRPLFRVSLALLWIWTAVVSVALYPMQQSAELLAAVAIPAAWANPVTISAAALDLLLGLALLCNRYLRSAALIQVVVIVIYTLIITIALPEYWLHPFGPISKNLPLLVATLMLIAMED